MVAFRGGMALIPHFTLYNAISTSYEHGHCMSIWGISVISPRVTNKSKSKISLLSASPSTYLWFLTYQTS